MIKSSQIVLKGVNCVHNDKIGANNLERSARISSYGLERNQLDTIQKSDQMVLK